MRAAPKTPVENSDRATTSSGPTVAALGQMARPSNAQKARAGRHFVVAELHRRGAGTVTLPDYQRSVEIVASDAEQTRTVTLRVKTKTTGDWQSTGVLGEKRTEDLDESRYWVLVDIGTDPSTPTSYFIVPEWWILNYIHKEFQANLARHGGRRPRNPESTHCAIRPHDMERWRDDWQALGVAATSRG
jgi:hypothetical protein